MSNIAYDSLSELERGDSGLRSFASFRVPFMYPIHAFGTEEQKTNICKMPLVVDGVWSHRTRHGSNRVGMVTRAVDDGDSYVINGAKCGSPMVQLLILRLYGQNWEETVLEIFVDLS